MKFNQTLTNVVIKIMKTGRVPMLLGEPGIGKSSWTEALAEAMHTKCFTLACNQLADKADLTGARLVPITEEKVQPDGSTITTTVGYKQVFYPHAAVMDAVLYAKKHKRETPILFLDELNRTTSDITSELLSIPTMRKLGDVELPPNLKVLTAGNDKGNITTLDSASISRFFLVHVDPDTSTFLGLDPNLNKFVRSVLEAHPECIFCKEITQISTDDDDDDGTVNIDEILDDGEQMSQFTTPRTIDAVSRFLNECSKAELIELTQTYTVTSPEPVCALVEVIEGFTGKTSFSTFLVENIMNGIANMDDTVAGAGIAKPTCYDDLKAKGTVDELNAFIKDMDERERSGCVAYALYEKDDNAVILKALAAVTDKLMPDDVKSLMRIASNDEGLDEDNVKALSDTNSTLSSTLSLLLSM